MGMLRKITDKEWVCQLCLSIDIKQPLSNSEWWECVVTESRYIVGSEKVYI